MTHLACAFEDLSFEATGQFDVVVLTEVTQHFDDLDLLFDACCRALEVGGRVVVSDVVTYRTQDRSRVPYHHRDAFGSLAAGHGFRTALQKDMTGMAALTLAGLLAG